MTAVQAEMPENVGLTRHSKAEQVEAQIQNSRISDQEKHTLISYLNFCWLEQHRKTVIAHLRKQEPEFEKTERARLTAHYKRPMQRLKLLINQIPDEAVKISIDRQTRQLLEAQRSKTTLLALTLDPESSHYFRRPNNEIDSKLHSQTALGVLELIRAYDWRQQPASMPRTGFANS